ncbi:MAG: SDR family oxidoreductase [Oscillospiraceae bacterium]|nr:SDR family oxidoreductase [Oscillospiraceae bacterium]
MQHITSMDNAFSLEGKTAIVTGGNRGIGLGITTALAHHGANVAILCRREESARSVIADLSSKYPGKFTFFKCDIADYDLCKSAVKGVIEEYGIIDILVNNAGIGIVGEMLDMEEDLEPWFHCFDVDLHGAARMCYLVGKHMREHGKGGRVINITSNAGEIVNKPMSLMAYSCAKSALNMLTKHLAFQWGKDGIRVNAIAPGYTFSDMAKTSKDDEAYKIMCEKIPVGRFGEAVEIGALAVYLASTASDIMTGAILTIDGGYSLGV